MENRGTSLRPPVEWTGVDGACSRTLAGHDWDARWVRERGRCFKFMHSASRAAAARFPRILPRPPLCSGPRSRANQPLRLDLRMRPGTFYFSLVDIFCTPGISRSTGAARSGIPLCFSFLSGLLPLFGCHWLHDSSWLCAILDPRFGKTLKSHGPKSGKGGTSCPTSQKCHLRDWAPGSGQPNVSWPTRSPCLSPVTPTLFCLTEKQLPSHP